MSVVQELKAKRAEFEERLKAIRAETTDLTAKMAALDAVIQIYDPQTSASKVTRGSQPTPLSNINKRQALLEVLRRAMEPQSTANCVAALVRSSGEGLSAKEIARLTNGVSSALDSLVKQGRVRRVQTLDGHRWLWEIAT